MPTPVTSAKQCLTDDAARALDDAVSVARRRSHSQTTSLHAVSALLSLPTSTLRDACARARTLTSCSSPRLQFRALELCVSVALDRLPASKSKTLDAEPPVSNSLMAAIKRSQANQRRHPETFHLYQMHQQMHNLHNSQTSSFSSIKVELKHFILSILDDPIVSRVFGGAGFRSSDIKIAILNRPSSSGFRRSLTFPLYLNNNSNNNGSGINFPFAVDNGEEEDFKRVGSVLVKETLRNPLLIGESADTVVTGFIDRLKIGKVDFLPSEIGGLEVVNIGKEIGEFVLGELSKDLMGLKLKEVKEKVESCGKCGVIINFGDMKVFVEGGLVEYVVLELGNLVNVCGGKLWLIGSVGSYDVYLKVLGKFGNLEKDWGLNLVPITCSRLNTKSSLMGSFVPFGGFFEQPELENASSKDELITRCDICNEKCEQEVAVVVNRGRMVSVADQPSTSLASWMQVPESDQRSTGVTNARVTGVRRKWADICHRLHHNPQPQQNSSHVRARIPFPHHFQPDPKRGEVSGSTTTTSMTTNLGLGTVYVSRDPGPRQPAREARLETFNGPCTADINGKDFKELYRVLADKVGYQTEPIRAISQTVTRIRSGNQKRHVWFMFSGPDPVGKRKICTTLAKAVFGSPESLISIDLNIENQTPHPGSIFNRQNINFSDPCFRGKTVTELIAEELTKKPRSVVLLEHIDKADLLTKDDLSRAIKTGRLTDSCGRETRITDGIFVFTIGTNEEENVKDFLTYSEERMLNAQPLQMKILVEKARPGSSSIFLSPKDSIFRNSEMSNKRKIIEIDAFEIMVPRDKKPRSCFDLNIPLDEPEESDNESVSEAKESWLEEFSGQVDEKVVFGPFDFDSRAETILKGICKCFEKSFGSRVGLEIESEAMVQILAACWLSDGNGGVENWIETVLCEGLMEVEKKHGVDGESMVKLVTIRGVKIEEDDALFVCLPSRVMVE